MKKFFVLGCLIFIATASPVWGQSSLPQGKLGSTDSSKGPGQTLIEVQREMVELDKQFEQVRKDLFFPKDEEVLVYLRNALKETFPVKSMELYLNDKKIYSHIYTDSEKVAFNFSSLQPLHRFNLGNGTYQMMARFFLAEGGLGMQEKRFTFVKETQPRFIEIELGFDRKQKTLLIAEKLN